MKKLILVVGIILSLLLTGCRQRADLPEIWSPGVGVSAAYRAVTPGTDGETSVDYSTESQAAALAPSITGSAGQESVYVGYTWQDNWLTTVVDNEVTNISNVAGDTIVEFQGTGDGLIYTLVLNTTSNTFEFEHTAYLELTNLPGTDDTLVVLAHTETTNAVLETKGFTGTGILRFFNFYQADDEASIAIADWNASYQAGDDSIVINLTTWAESPRFAFPSQSVNLSDFDTLYASYESSIPDASPADINVIMDTNGVWSIVNNT